jgi:maltose-binding protein MalE
MWEENLKKYDELVAKYPRFDRKGKSMPYTSANGHMFSLLNKAGELGIRFSKEVQEKYMQELNTTYFKSHGASIF